MPPSCTLYRSSTLLGLCEPTVHSNGSSLVLVPDKETPRKFANTTAALIVGGAAALVTLSGCTLEPNPPGPLFYAPAYTAPPAFYLRSQSYDQPVEPINCSVLTASPADPDARSASGIKPGPASPTMGLPTAGDSGAGAPLAAISAPAPAPAVPTWGHHTHGSDRRWLRT
jgi:hypothetical protein